MIEWIKCINRFPVEGEECLVAFYILPPDSGCGHAFSLATFSNYNFYSWELQKEIGHVTHWMPLPNSPKKPNE